MGLPPPICTGPLARHRRGSISAVFPSTTASAVTTSFTGATTVEHGLTGWFTYFSEASCVGAPLPFVRRGEKAPLAAAPERIFVAPPLFDGLAVRSLVVSWRQIIDSTYNRHHCGRAERLAYDNLEGFLAQTVDLGRTEPVVQDFAAVEGELRADIQEKKLRLAMAQEFDRLKETAQIDNFLAGTSQSGQKAAPPATSREAALAPSPAGSRR